MTPSLSPRPAVSLANWAIYGSEWTRRHTWAISLESFTAKRNAGRGRCPPLVGRLAVRPMKRELISTAWKRHGYRSRCVPAGPTGLRSPWADSSRRSQCRGLRWLLHIGRYMPGGRKLVSMQRQTSGQDFDRRAFSMAARKFSSVADFKRRSPRGAGHGETEG